MQKFFGKGAREKKKESGRQRKTEREFSPPKTLHDYMKIMHNCWECVVANMTALTVITPSCCPLFSCKYAFPVVFYTSDV